MKQYSIPGLVFSFLLLIVHFFPDMGGADVMGIQWLYTGIIDLLALLFITIHRREYIDAINKVFTLKFSLVFSALVLWATISLAYALNATETLVTLGRLITTYFVFINLSILFYGSDVKNLLNVVGYIMAGILLYDSIYILRIFSEGIETKTISEIVGTLTGNHGNKNVFAASLLIKFPFVVWLILNQSFWGKTFNTIVLFVGVNALFIMNTRSTYVGLVLITVIFIVTTIYFKRKSTKQSLLVQLAWFVVPVFAGFLSANTLLQNAETLQGSEGGYTTVVKRFSAINVKSEEGSRIHLWKGAIDYATKHPILGCGYGNWKLASIPYEKEFTNDLFVPYHCHNDFIEMFADLGLVGGLLFASMFVLILFMSIHLWRHAHFEKYKLSTTILLMAIACYAIDAFFNFPAERPAMQIMLSMAAALFFVPYLSTEKEKDGKLIPFSAIYLTLGFALLLGSNYIAQQTYASLKVQKYVMGEIDSDPKMPLDEVKDAFPKIPNLSTSTLPIPALIARYHFRDKQYDEALRLLKESDQVNPYLYYNDFIRTAIYGAKNNYDSTFYFAHRAFYNWPRATSYYKNMIFAAAKKQDTTEIIKSFNLYKKYRDGAEAWNQYLLAMYEVKKGVDPRLKLQLDSILLKYPGDSALLSKVKGLYNSNASVVAIVNNAANYTEEGARAFIAKNYAKAASLYIKAAQQDPANYTHYENVAISYYTMQDFPKAIQYFSKAMQYPTEQTGKSEFFLAMCYIAQNKSNLACEPLQKAKKKGYPGVDLFIKQYCK